MFNRGRSTDGLPSGSLGGLSSRGVKLQSKIGKTVGHSVQPLATLVVMKDAEGSFWVMKDAEGTFWNECEGGSLLGWRPPLLGWRPPLLGWRPSLVGWRTSLLGWRPSLLGWRPSLASGRPSLLGWSPSLLGWRPSLVGWRPSLLGWRPLLLGLEAIALRLEAIPLRLEAIASRLEAIALRLEAIAIRLEAIASRLEATALRLEATASRLEAIALRLEDSFFGVRRRSGLLKCDVSMRIWSFTVFKGSAQPTNKWTKNHLATPRRLRPNGAYLVHVILPPLPCFTKLTLPGTNMKVENGPLEDHFPLQTGGFPLPC